MEQYLQQVIHGKSWRDTDPYDHSQELKHAEAYVSVAQGPQLEVSLCVLVWPWSVILAYLPVYVSVALDQYYDDEHGL